MTLAARHGELAGHLHGYDAATVTRAIRQTLANPRLTYLALPDEAQVGDLAGPWVRGRCLVHWRDDARQFTYVCLLELGHDDEAAHAPDELVPEHGWYKLLDAYDRGAQAMNDAADRIEARRQAALGRLEGERLDALRHGA